MVLRSAANRRPGRPLQVQEPERGLSDVLAVVADAWPSTRLDRTPSDCHRWQEHVLDWRRDGWPRLQLESDVSSGPPDAQLGRRLDENRVFRPR